MRKRGGPNAVLRGTPDKTGDEVDQVSFACTHYIKEIFYPVEDKGIRLTRDHRHQCNWETVISGYGEKAAGVAL